MSRIYSILVVFGALSLLCGAQGAAAQTQPPPELRQLPTVAAPAAGQPSVSVADEAATLGPGDVVEVTLIGRTDYDARTKVQADGTVLLPLVGAVPASGLTPVKLAENVRAALQQGGFFPDPQVHVEMAQVASRYATVLGFVAQPGLIPLDRDYRLSELIARVGGRSSAGADYALLTRPDGSSKRYSLVDLATGGRDSDPLVAAGDKVYVPAAENDVFYLTGQVKTPGAYPTSADMTVRIALARGGGVSQNGSEKRVKIIRHGVPVKNVKLDVTKVEPGDIITVGERLF